VLTYDGAPPPALVLARVLRGCVQACLLADHQEQGRGGVQARPLPGHAAKLHALGLLRPPHRPPQQHPRRHHQRHRACHRGHLPPHLLHLRHQTEARQYNDPSLTSARSINLCFNLVLVCWMNCDRAYLCLQLRILGVLAVEAVFMVIVVCSVLMAAHTHKSRSMIVGVLCVIFGAAMYFSPLTIMVSTHIDPALLIHSDFHLFVASGSVRLKSLPRVRFSQCALCVRIRYQDAFN
jgi:hypothetical protein